jgi:hypothetical protein
VALGTFSYSNEIRHEVDVGLGMGHPVLPVHVLHYGAHVGLLEWWWRSTIGQPEGGPRLEVGRRLSTRNKYMR